MLFFISWDKEPKNSKVPVSELISTHLFYTPSNLRLIILPHCIDCFNRIPQAIEHSFSQRQESFLIIGDKAEINVLKNAITAIPKQRP